jgi:hypothetical protein
MMNSLNIETGRYKNIIRPERKCTNCSKGDIEDEKHFIVDCPLYENIRVKFLLPMASTLSPFQKSRKLLHILSFTCTCLHNWPNLIFKLVIAIGSNRGKLDTYFYIKTHFGKEKYLEINKFDSLSVR